MTVAAAGVVATSVGISHGYDVSYPQCGTTMPAPPMDFVIIGVNGGRAMTPNPCFGAQLQWARRTAAPAVYVNTNSAPITYTNANCKSGDYWCASYYYGKDAATYALAYAGTSGPELQVYWLDVETGNFWTSDTSANAHMLMGMIDALSAAGKQIGIYSTSYQFGKIAGSYQPNLPIWAPIPGTTLSAVGQVCRTAPAFGGGTIVMLQTTGQFDENFICPPRNLPNSVTVPGLSS